MQLWQLDYQTDENSANGTCPNHRRIDQADLRVGDELIAGTTKIVVVSLRLPASVQVYPTPRKSPDLPAADVLPQESVDSVQPVPPSDTPTDCQRRN